MPQITTIRVVRRRSVQPEQFGNAAAEVELTGNVLEGEDFQSVARQMLVTSRALVYENLGLKLPQSALKNAEEVDTPAETATVEPAGETKKRGRPKGSGKKAVEAKTVEKSDDDEIPSDDDTSTAEVNTDDVDIPDDDPQPNIRTNPENRQNPEDDIPDDDDETPGGLTAAELHVWFNDQIPHNLNPARAKEILAGLGVARIRDLDTQEKIDNAEKVIRKAMSEE